MGQQQLLLLVLSAIIVGVSIMIGINMFTSSAVQANQDAVVQDCMMIAARAQEWWRKPAAMGGGNRTFTGVTLTALNIDSVNVNVSAPYTLDVAPQLLTITGTGVEGIKVTVVVDPDSIVSTNFELAPVTP